MPRIPVRTEPYTSPSRQHRHYKNKRDQVLRSLGKAAYINGSHFAIMWVSARGDVETYASEALQGRLDDWFVKQGVADEAKELVRQYRNSSTHAHPIPQPIFFDGDDDGDDGADEDGLADGSLSDDGNHLGESILDNSRPGTTASSVNRTINMPSIASDVFTDGDGARPKLERSLSTSANGIGVRARRPIAPLDTNTANDQFHRSNATLAVTGAHTGVPNSFGIKTSFGYHEGNESGEFSNFGLPHTAPIRGVDENSHQGPSMTQLGRTANGVIGTASNLVETTFNNLAARTAFLELRFSQLQQGMCKTVAKAWIKIIEPKKQTRCPYNKGEEGKPDWWPEGVRHKEPDHLMKPERHALLLTILRSPRVKVARLQLATAEVVALIKADKVSLLMDVYRIAREEEKMREAGINLDSVTTVSISTMEGWSEAGQCAVDVERPGSPGAANALEAGEDLSDRKGKRRSGTALARSASASTTQRREKRKTTDGPNMPATSFGSHSFVQTGHSAPNFNAHSTSSSVPLKRPASQAQTWLLHEPTQYGVKRTSISSHTLSSSNSQRQLATNGQTQHSLHEQYGLITPLTANTQLMDPSFLAAVKENHNFNNNQGGELRPQGYMSAPTSHTQLPPHEMPYNHSPDFSAHQQGQTSQSSITNQQQYYYDLQSANVQYGSPSIVDLNQAQMSAEHAKQATPSGQESFVYSGQTSGTATGASSIGNGSALGLHGIGISWNQGAGFPSGFNCTDVDSAMGWWNNPSASKHSAMASNAMPEPAFDNSFASTIDSGGPSTPPPASAVGLTAGGKATQTWTNDSRSHQPHSSRMENVGRGVNKIREGGMSKTPAQDLPPQNQPNASFEHWMFTNQAQGSGH